MGIDAVLSLPGNVRLQDVKEVLWRLYGTEEKQVLYVPGSDFTYGELFIATSVGYHDQTFLLCAEPGEDLRLLNNERSEFAIPCDRFFWSFEGGNGTRRLHRIANPWTIAVLKALADFFGGTVDFDDSDDSYADHVVEPGSNERNCPTDGYAWQGLMGRLADVGPLDQETRARDDSNAFWFGT